jgi:signal transduction histidine kinase
MIPGGALIMITAKIPIDEAQRLNELYRYEILDTPTEEEFDKLALLASQICRTPMSTISFIDRKRQWAKSIIGLKKIPEDRNSAFCSHTILNNNLLIVKNALRDRRFHDNPLVKQKPKIRFYAGMPLVTPRGYKLGALCVIDTIPRKLTQKQIFALKVLSKQVVNLMELRIQNRDIVHTTQMQQQIISIMSHDIRSPLSSIKTFLDLKAGNNVFTKKEQEDMFSVLSSNVSRTLQLLDNLVEWGKAGLEYTKRHEILKLREVVQECIDQAELNSILKENIIINEVAPDVLLTADKEALQFILRNLISNANKFTDKGTIRISFFTKNDRCYLNVKDSGVGLETDKITKIMQQPGLFHTSGTQKEKGHGLGLSLIKSYLTKTGNEFEIKSLLNKGTSVWFSICPIDQLVPILA